MNTPEVLTSGIDGWRKAAKDFRDFGNVKMAETCEHAAVSLEIERDTGIAVCTCCYKPFGQGITFLHPK